MLLIHSINGRYLISNFWHVVILEFVRASNKGGRLLMSRYPVLLIRSVWSMVAHMGLSTFFRNGNPRPEIFWPIMRLHDFYPRFRFFQTNLSLSLSLCIYIVWIDSLPFIIRLNQLSRRFSTLKTLTPLINGICLHGQCRIQWACRRHRWNQLLPRLPRSLVELIPLWVWFYKLPNHVKPTWNLAREIIWNQLKSSQYKEIIRHAHTHIY